MYDDKLLQNVNMLTNSCLSVANLKIVIPRVGFLKNVIIYLFVTYMTYKTEEKHRNICTYKGSFFFLEINRNM